MFGSSNMTFTQKTLVIVSCPDISWQQDWLGTNDGLFERPGAIANQMSENQFAKRM
jgi:hypothetical protein